MQAREFCLLMESAEKWGLRTHGEKSPRSPIYRIAHRITRHEVTVVDFMRVMAHIRRFHEEES